VKFFRTGYNFRTGVIFFSKGLEKNFYPYLYIENKETKREHIGEKFSNSLSLLDLIFLLDDL